MKKPPPLPEAARKKSSPQVNISPKKTVALIVLAGTFVSIVVFGVLLSIFKTTSEVKRAAEEAWQDKWVKVDGSWYTKKLFWVSSPQYFEIKDRNLSTVKKNLTEADRRNGIEWKGYVNFFAEAYRETVIGGKEWKEWQDPKHDIFRGGPAPVMQVHVVRQNGEWKRVRAISSQFVGRFARPDEEEIPP